MISHSFSSEIQQHFQLVLAHSFVKSFGIPTLINRSRMEVKREWWKEVTIYQIYPRSFCDSNGDGIGDLAGITSKLDYIKTLGVDAIWFCPVYDSPNDDNGYDISDYHKIMKEFGTEEDFNNLLKGIHDRGMKLIMDFVANHCSDEHFWFKESRKSKDNPYRDFFYWRPPNHTETGGPNGEPNNWSSFFAPSAWEFDEITGEYYLHLFSKKQPDLNWENPKVREEIRKIMKFWLDKGVDGWRLDALNVISKTEGLPSVPGKGYQWGGQYFFNGPKMVPWMREIREKILVNYDVITVAETPGMSLEQALEIIEPETGAFNMLFHFELMDVDKDMSGSSWKHRTFNLKDVKDITSTWQVGVHGKGWNSLYLENHDQPRCVSRFGSAKFRGESAKMLATWLHMQQGTPFIYQGQELGMMNVDWNDLSELRDIDTYNMWHRESAKGTSPQELIQAIRLRSRDNARTPMQWDDSQHAGFTSGIPWIRVNSDFQHVNVKFQLEDVNSVLNYYIKLNKLRKMHPIIVYGDFNLKKTSDQIFAFVRKLGIQKLLVVANFYEDEAEFEIPGDFTELSKKDLIISNWEVVQDENSSFKLKPFEVRVYLVNQ
eukprot:TRINITY_DN7086_c0_g1_i1.p1 TRINITY_DN7086_c0_g1~~TRINITY_DN7086_c0_g1_i1.p1  ORF type:complete len:601 (+),score=204.51 TRINITY_DN7086_c0_g1_i1:184-1986(+)